MAFKQVKLENYTYPDIAGLFLPVALVSDRPEALILFQAAGGPIWDGTESSVHRLRFHALTVFAPNWNYNVQISWNPDWVFHNYFVNITPPMKWNGEVCSYVDLELFITYETDNSNLPDSPEKRGVLAYDRYDLEYNKQLYDYPPEIWELAETTREEVLRQIKTRAFPFDDSLLNWRPDSEMLSLAELPDNAATWHL